MFEAINLACFLLAALSLLAIFVLYPLYLYLHPVSPRIVPPAAMPLPRVSMIIVAHNAEDLIEDKIHNSLALDYPDQCIEFFVCSDGSSDRTAELVRAFTSARLHLRNFRQQRGKAAIINDVVESCSGELLLFSDVDAMLEPDSLRRLVAHFTDRDIGGVSGARVIVGRDDARLLEPQRRYVFADSVVKLMESRIGSATSNDGKLYVIRREVFRPIDRSATDDLFTCLNIVSQGKRFVYEPGARAVIRQPSLGPAHEIRRRRRIVCRSLAGIWAMRAVLNPFRFRAFAIGLLINKVMRRMLPVLLIMLFASSLALAFEYPGLWPLVVLQAGWYLLAGLHLIAARTHLPLPSRLCRAAALAAYFVVGNVGTLFGVVDFLRGVRYVTWEPLKAAPRD